MTSMEDQSETHYKMCWGLQTYLRLLPDSTLQEKEILYCKQNECSMAIIHLYSAKDITKTAQAKI